MSTVFEGFVGPSYQLPNKYATIERTINWQLVANEAAGEEKKFGMALEPSPGNAPFCQLPVPVPFNQPCRGLLELRGTAYGVNGDTVFSIDANGNFTNIGMLEVDANPVSMVANGNGQIFIASAGKGYVIPNGGGAGSLLPVRGGLLGASYATFQDGYVIVVVPNSNQFQISGTDDIPLGDATQWDAANVSVQAGQADKLRAIISSREYLRLLGARRSQVYYDAGNQGIGAFPFQSYNETFIETGISAVFSLADTGSGLIWIGEDARGRRACWQDHAFQPQRISTFAVEARWDAYDRIDDAIAFTMIWQGHLQYVVTFPSAKIKYGLLAPIPPSMIGATWVYDVSMSELLGRPIWFERSYQTALGYAVARSEQFHCFCYGKHLVGSAGLDGNPGAIYQYSTTQYTDCGTDANGAQSQQPIVRDRISPHVFNGNKRVIYNRIEFELARGVGLDAGAFGADPQLLLRWSNDGGNAYGPEQNMPAGKIGQYGQRVYWNTCGYGRDRVFWLRATDPVYWGIVGAELDTIGCSS